MRLRDRLRKASNYVQKQRGPDSYFQYKRKREDERKDAEQGRERARDHAERERGEAERGREYEKRYTADRERADRESNIAEKRTEPAQETEPDP